MKKHNDILIVKNSLATEYIPLSQIIYCEKFKGGTKIHMVNPENFVADMELESIKKLINDNTFVKINDNQLFNTSYLKNHDKQFVTTILQHKLPITKHIK
jgi:two-component system LytT family response regulator